MNRVTKTFTITASSEVMERLEKFLAFFHYNGGHSGLFAMPFDGDGADYMMVDPKPPKQPKNSDFSIISNAGQDVEIAMNKCYMSRKIDFDACYYKAKDGKLIRVKDGIEEIRKEYDQSEEA